ncbi:MAG: SOS response-associated peptidase [Bacteroidetes bacterium]|nr:SOS response-associated peptidase [Bacteroidota bacterium]
MCNEIGVRPDLLEVVKAELGAPWMEGAPFTPKISIRPSDETPAVRLIDGQRVASNYMWGFLPPNAPSRKFISEYFTFNARDDKIATGRLYGKPFREARCLVTVSLWYETAKPPGEKKGTRCTVQPAKGGIFVFGGMWGPWVDPETEEHHDTATIITTTPNATIADLPHHRMPALLPRDAWADWLNPKTSVADLQDLLRAAPDEWLEVMVGRPKPSGVGEQTSG